MAKDIGITYYAQAKVKCSNCGSEYIVGSTVEELQTEVCGNCHPFYTGQDTIMDTTGRIERYQARLSKTQSTAPKSDKKAKTRRIRQALGDIEETQQSVETRDATTSK